MYAERDGLGPFVTALDLLEGPLNPSLKAPKPLVRRMCLDFAMMHGLQGHPMQVAKVVAEEP